MKNKKMVLFIALVLGILTVSATPALAQSTITFDEYGHSSGNFGILATNFGLDPLAVPYLNTPSNTLYYVLPFRVATGDLWLSSQSEPGNQLSDLVRFEDQGPGNGSRIYFYSDIDDADKAPADVGLPVLALANSNRVDEVLLSSGFNNYGATWTVIGGSGHPGDPGAGLTIQYIIISDIPEPGAGALVAMGGLAVAALSRRRNGRRW